VFNCVCQDALHCSVHAKPGTGKACASTLRRRIEALAECGYVSWLYGSTASTLSAVQLVGVTQHEAYSSSAHACREAAPSMQRVRGHVSRSCLRNCAWRDISLVRLTRGKPKWTARRIATNYAALHAARPWNQKNLDA
jgi:hypothetical protein